MSLRAAMRLALRDLEVIIVLEHLVVIDNRQNDLVQGFAKIFRSFLGDLGMLGFVL
jgi:hypothetical protein